MFKRLRDWLRLPAKVPDAGEEVEELVEPPPPFDPLKPYIISATLRVAVVPYPIETFSERVIAAFDKEAVASLLSIRKTFFHPQPDGTLKVFETPPGAKPN